MSGRWSLTTFEDHSGRVQAGVRRADGAVVQPEALKGYAGLAAALESWDDVSAALKHWNPDGLPAVEGAREVLSVRYPRKVICAGANYHDHIAEMGGGEVPVNLAPYFFFVPPTTSVIGDRDAILVDDSQAERTDWEAELAIVIGRGGYRIQRQEALSHIAGYASLSDITARGLFPRKVSLAPPFAWDWAGSKGRDTSTVLGAVTPAWQVEDPNDLAVRCWVNGELKQDGTTRDLIFSITELVAAASEMCTLEPGDIIATGTPAGVGAAKGEQLHPGDVVRVEIEGLAAIENTVELRASAQQQDREGTK